MNDYLLAIIALLQIVLAFFSARSTASTEAIKAQSDAIRTLRTEREADRKALIEITKESRAQAQYINTLVALMVRAGIEVPIMPEIKEDHEA